MFSVNQSRVIYAVGGGVLGFIIGGIASGVATHILTKKAMDTRIAEDFGVDISTVQECTGDGYFMSRTSSFGVDCDTPDTEAAEDNYITIPQETEDETEEEGDNSDDSEADSENVEEYMSITARYNQIKENFDFEHAIIESPTEEDLNSDPYIISPEEYVDENSHYDKMGYRYLVEDGVVLDENDDVVEDVDRYLGNENLILFRSHEELGMLYIRNDATYTDYEIEKVYSDYLGYTGADVEMDSTSDDTSNPRMWVTEYK